MNKFASYFKPLAWFLPVLLATFVAGCGGGGGSGGAGTVASASVLPGAAGTSGAAATNPTVSSSTPSNGATNVATSTNGPGNVVTGKILTATFSQAMLPLTITTVGTFTLKETVTGINVPGTVTIDATNTIATFTPTAAALLVNTNYTATVSTAAKNAGGTAMPSNVAWTFTTAGSLAAGQAPLDLTAIKAGNFAIFAATGITDTPPSPITGSIGNSGLGSSIVVPCTDVLGVDANGVANKVYDKDAGFTDAACRLTSPAMVAAAQGNMQAAFTDAAGRPAGVGPALNIGGGTVSTQTLAPGVYTWGTPVTITGNLTLSGGADDVWIFQMTQTLAVQPDIKILLSGGAQAKNIFWQASGTVTLFPGSHMEGIILGQTLIATQAGSSVNGRLLAQAAVTLISTTVTLPAP